MTLLTPATTHVYSPAERPLTPEEARVLGTLMEKARTVPDSYPMTLYRALYGEQGLWVRPAAMFEETIEVGGVRQPRFVRVTAESPR